MSIKKIIKWSCIGIVVSVLSLAILLPRIVPKLIDTDYLKNESLKRNLTILDEIEQTRRYI